MISSTEAAATLVQVTSIQNLNELKKNVTNKCIALLFWAEWHQPCHVLKEMLSEMTKVYKEVIFTWVSPSSRTFPKSIRP